MENENTETKLWVHLYEKGFSSDFILQPDCRKPTTTLGSHAPYVKTCGT
jgi:hypothetical protein